MITNVSSQASAPVGPPHIALDMQPGSTAETSQIAGSADTITCLPAAAQSPLLIGVGACMITGIGLMHAFTPDDASGAVKSCEAIYGDMIGGFLALGCVGTGLHMLRQQVQRQPENLVQLPTVPVTPSTPEAPSGTNNETTPSAGAL